MALAAPAAPRRAAPTLALVVPCYNEEATLPATLATLSAHLSQWQKDGLIAANSFVCYVDDGSADATWSQLAQAASPACRALKLAHNVGHQNALFAGMAHVSDLCDCCVSLDADLQDDLAAIPQMLHHYQDGKEVVYGVRNDRSSDSFIKRAFALAYYYLARALGIAGIPNHADYRLMSRRALLIIRQFSEQHLYWRGIVPSLNLPSAQVYYARQARQTGETKYTLPKMIGLALSGMTSFSIAPLRAITLLGFIISAFSLYLIASILYNFIGSGAAAPSLDSSLGWRAILISLYLLGGLIMLSIGIAGEYIGKIFIESKKRPLFVIETSVGAPAAAPPQQPQQQ